MVTAARLLAPLPAAGRTLVLALMSLTAVAVAAVLVVGAWQDVFAGFAWDDAWYLLMADRYSPFGGGHAPALAQIIHQRSYPPLYPLYLALAGGGSESIGVAHLATSIALVASLVAAFAWLRREGEPVAGAWGLVLACAFAPSTMLQFQGLWSEHLYLGLSLGVMASLAGREPRAGQWWLAAALVALCALTRVAGWAMVAVFVPVVLWARPAGRGGLIALAIVPAAAERLSNALVAPGTPTYLGVFISGLEYQLSPDSLAANLGALWSAIEDSFGRGAVGAIAILLLALPVWLRRLRAGRIDAVYAPVYLGMIVAWMFPEHLRRFLFPLVPVVLFYAYCAVRALLRRIVPAHAEVAGAGAGLALFVLVAIPGAALLASALAAPAPAGLGPWRHTSLWLEMKDEPRLRESAAQLRRDMIGDMRFLGERSREGDCVYTEFPPVVQLYTKRVAVDPPWNDLGAIGADRWSCRWYYLVPMYRREWMQFRDGLPPGPYTVVRRTPMPDPRDPVGTLSLLLRYEGPLAR